MSDMEQAAEPTPIPEIFDEKTLARETSLVRGGPFYRAQEAVRLLTPERWNLGRRILLAIGIGWLPLVLITLLFRREMIRSLLTDYMINVRMLIAVPILLIGQVLMEHVLRIIVRHIHSAVLLLPAEETKEHLTILKLIRLRDSIVAEGVIVAIAYAHFVIAKSHAGMDHIWAVSGVATGTHLSMAGWYYALVSQLLYQLLLGISLWKWVLWICFLFRLSKLDLQLVPTHPDEHGGLGFLGMSPIAIAPTIFVASLAIGSTWRTQILHDGAHLMNFKIDAIVWLVVVLLISMGPLALFVPRLTNLRRQGILQYGALGQLHSTEFHKKWILNNIKGHEEEFLTAPEVSTLTDFATSYENVEKLKPFPLDQGTMIGVILATVLPMLPVILAEIPFITVLKGLLSAVK